MKTDEMKLRLPARAGAAGEDGNEMSGLVLSDMHSIVAHPAPPVRLAGFNCWRCAGALQMLLTRGAIA